MKKISLAILMMTLFSLFSFQAKVELNDNCTPEKYREYIEKAMGELKLERYPMAFQYARRAANCKTYYTRDVSRIKVMIYDAMGNSDSVVKYGQEFLADTLSDYDKEENKYFHEILVKHYRLRENNPLSSGQGDNDDTTEILNL